MDHSTTRLLGRTTRDREDSLESLPRTVERAGHEDTRNEVARLPSSQFGLSTRPPTMRVGQRLAAQHSPLKAQALPPDASADHRMMRWVHWVETGRVACE